MFKKNHVKRMSRKELLELLVLQSKKIEELNDELKRVNGLLKDREIIISTSGSIAEAALKLNKVFETAQLAADQYLDNIKGIRK